jgi:hypothetical protein
MSDIQSMVGKEVEVLANGMTYTGMLIEVTDEEVQLKGPLQWISLPVSLVSEVRLKDRPLQKNERFSEWSEGE